MFMNVLSVTFCIFKGFYFSQGEAPRDRTLLIVSQFGIGFRWGRHGSRKVCHSRGLFLLDVRFVRGGLGRDEKRIGPSQGNYRGVYRLRKL